MLRRPYLILVAFTFLVPLSPAQAKVGRVDRVLFESRPKSLDFTFTATTEIDGSKASALPHSDKSLLILRLGGVTTKRRWVKLDDPMIKRALLHPDRREGPGAILRIRMNKKIIEEEILQGISVVMEDSGIRVSVPRPGTKIAPPVNKPAPAAEMATTPTVSSSALEQPNAPTPPEVGPGGISSLPPPMIGTPGELEVPEPEIPALERTPVTVADGKAPESKTPGVSSEPEDATDSATIPNIDEPEETPSEEKEQVPSNDDKPPTPDPLSAPPRVMSEAPDTDSLAFLPGTRTRDILAGYTDLVLRLETGMRTRPGIHRIAVFPFIPLDRRTKTGNFPLISETVVTNRLVRRPGIVQADRELVQRTIGPLKRDEMGRVNMDEARAAGVLVGADTLIVGTVGAEGDGYMIDARAIDVETGNRLSVVTQEFDGASMNTFAEAVQDERTFAGSVYRSLALPGWGQTYQGELGRGSAYMTLFGASLVTAIASSLIAYSAEQDYRNGDDPSTLSKRQEADDAYSRANSFYAGAAIIYGTALIDTLLTGENKLRIDLKRYMGDPNQ